MDVYMLYVFCEVRYYAFAKLRTAAINFVTSICLSVCPPARNYSAPTGWILMKLDI
jgi:hypothetical protein